MKIKVNYIPVVYRPVWLYIKSINGEALEAVSSWDWELVI